MCSKAKNIISIFTIQIFVVLAFWTFAQAQPLPGDALVISLDGGTGNKGALYSVDLTPGPTFGDRTLISDFGNPAQGPLGAEPFHVTLDGSGDALVIDEEAGTDDLGALFSVDLTPGPTFGDRTLISDWGNAAQGPLGEDQTKGVTLDGSGDALVTSEESGTDDKGALYSVDLTPGPTFGDRALISDWGNAAQGFLGRGPVGVTLDGAGDALVANTGNTLISVDLTPGANIWRQDTYKRLR